MKIGKLSWITLGVLAILAAALLGACAHGGHPHEGKAEGAGAAIYWCGNAPEGPFTEISTTPGKCADGTPKNGGHVVWVQGSIASVCACGPTCTCKINRADRTCGCGKPVVDLDLTGTGIYYCNCKGTCGCNTISNKPGKCGCGMPLRQK